MTLPDEQDKSMLAVKLPHKKNAVSFVTSDPYPIALNRTCDW